jgi:hypothetical protein
LLIVLALVSGCDAGITRGPMISGPSGTPDATDPGSDGPGPGADPRDVFASTALPELLIECGSCHATPERGVGFLSGVDAYAALLAWPTPLIVPGEPAASLLVTKGPHSGPALSARAARVVSTWIELEGRGGGAVDADAGAPGAGGGGGSGTGPVAYFTATPDPGGDPLAIVFDASRSSDPDGRIATYAWRFGDGEVGIGVTTSHVFARADTYAVVLTLTDDAGDTATSTQVIDVGTGLPRVFQMVLIDADTDTDIPAHTPLVNGAIVDTVALGTTNFSIRADTAPERVGSVRFTVDAVLDFQTESNPPYAIAGDSDGDYVAWAPEPGDHLVTAMPFTEDDAGGDPGMPLTVRFTVR